MAGKLQIIKTEIREYRLNGLDISVFERYDTDKRIFIVKSAVLRYEVDEEGEVYVEDTILGCRCKKNGEPDKRTDNYNHLPSIGTQRADVLCELAALTKDDELFAECAKLRDASYARDAMDKKNLLKSMGVGEIDGR